MQLIIHVLFIFIALNCLLKLSFWKWWQAVVFSVLCALFVAAAYPYAIEQSRTQIADFLNNQDLMQDAAVLVTIESAIGLSFCFMAMNRLFGDKSRYYGILRSFPSILIFPVLFYALTALIFTFPGAGFSTTAYVFAGVLLVATPLCSYCIRKLLPEDDLRLEIHFLVSLFTALIGLITTVNGKVTYAVADTPLNGRAVGLSAGFFILLTIAGYVWYRLKWKTKK